MMVEELVQLYAAYSQGLDVVLPALPIQYADYALWQRSWMEAGEKERQLAYWTGLLGGEQPVASIQVPGRVQSRVNLMAGGKMRVERIKGQMYFPYPDF